MNCAQDLRPSLSTHTEHSSTKTLPSRRTQGEETKIPLMAGAVKRWIVDISNWNPVSEDFISNLALLPRAEQSSVTRYVKWDDRKRALVSRLLQYSVIRQALRIPLNQIIIKRSVEGKPYLEYDDHQEETNRAFPNFNFNVSHHGDLVAIASEPYWLVGLDVVSHHHHPIRGSSTESFLHKFSSYFSSREWERIMSSCTSDEMLEVFWRLWSLKEAFVKAIGCGMSYDELDKVEFHHRSDWTNVCVLVDGEELRDWQFWCFEPKKGHYVSLALGSPRMATENYKKTLRPTDFDGQGDCISGSLLSPHSSFEWLTVEQLVSMCKGGCF